jgi:hypothetical protein
MGFELERGPEAHNTYNQERNLLQTLKFERSHPLEGSKE